MRQQDGGKLPKSLAGKILRRKLSLEAGDEERNKKTEP